MKLSLKILVFIFFSINIYYINAKAASYKLNDTVENKFSISKKFQIKLPKGKWVIAEKSREDYYGLRTKIYSLLRIENKRIVEAIEIAEMHTAGIYEPEVNQAIYEAIFKNKYDGCYERPEYSVLKFYVKGSTHNCFWLGHSDIYKDLFTPEDPEQKTANAQLRRYIKQNQLQFPKVGLFSNHFYFSRLKAGKWRALSYAIDPKILGAPKNKYVTEESSEYHRNNIENYPEHKKIMQKWISISAHRHIEFEKIVKALDRHKLDLRDLSPMKSFSSKNSSIDIADEINKLNDLYKSGILTKEEFDKAKNKILN
jgi:hypothetical protein